MIHLVLYTAWKEEGRRLLSAIRDQAAMDWLLKLDYQVFSRLEDAAAYLQANGAAAIGWDMSDLKARDAFVQVRPSCQDAFLLVMAASNTSPLTFLNPEVAPDSLIIYPFDHVEAGRAAKEMLSAIRRMQQKSEGCFVIKWKDAQQRVPYDRIYYFESRERKLYARLRGEELGFSGTMDQLEGQLPDTFQRCHRSYIVNTALIERVLYAQGMITMWDGITLPLSRSYKKSLRDCMERGGG